MDAYNNVQLCECFSLIIAFKKRVLCQLGSVQGEEE